jgi:hypothetical protein
MVEFVIQRRGAVGSSDFAPENLALRHRTSIDFGVVIVIRPQGSAFKRYSGKHAARTLPRKNLGVHHGICRRRGGPADRASHRTGVPADGEFVGF